MRPESVVGRLAVTRFAADLIHGLIPAFFPLFPESTGLRVTAVTENRRGRADDGG